MSLIETKRTFRDSGSESAFTDKADRDELLLTDLIL
jgi:hypothetical protein